MGKGHKIHWSRQQGFTLIEVLVTSVIIAIGVVGLVTLQLNELRTTRNALVSNHTSMLLNDITERVRSNPSQLAAYNIEYSGNPVAIDCKTQRCSALEMAQYDQYIWQNLLKTNLSSGGGEINLVGNNVTFIIRWDQNRDGSSGTNCPVLTEADLDCVQVTINI